MFRGILTLALIGALFTGCNKSDGFLFGGNFETRFLIPSGLNTVLTHYIVIPNVYTDFNRVANNAGFDAQGIKSIQASFGKMRTFFSSDDLDFLQDISVVIISRKNPALKKEMYYSEFVPFNVDNEIKLQSGSAELAEILKEDYIDIEIRMNIRGFVPNAIEAVLDISYIAL